MRGKDSKRCRLLTWRKVATAGGRMNFADEPGKR